MIHRVFGPLAAVVLLLVLAAPVAAWTPPGITTDCSPTQGQYAYTVTLSGNEPNYSFDYADNAAFTGAVTVAGAKGANALTVPIATLYVRWSADTSSKASKAGSATPCQQEPTPTPTPTPTAHVDPFFGFASVSCDRNQTNEDVPGYVLTWGADNVHGDDTIEVRLFLNGVDSGVTPLVMLVGHRGARFSDYSVASQVTLYVGELAIFDAFLPLPNCVHPTKTPHLTLPPTATLPPSSPPSDPRGLLAVIYSLALVSVGAGWFRRRSRA